MKTKANPKNKAVLYGREPHEIGLSAPYNVKFSGLIKTCEKAKGKTFENIVVTWPWILGDNGTDVMIEPVLTNKGCCGLLVISPKQASKIRNCQPTG